MSVSNQTNKISGSGNSSTTTFSYPFKIFDVSELYAYLIDSLGNVTGPLTYTTDFTATISTVIEGGTITFVVAPPTGTTWFLKRIVPYTQSASIPSEGTFPGKQFENQLDLITMMVIQANETVTRCLQLSPTYLGALPVVIPGGLANAAIGWDPTGTFLTNLQVTSIGPVTVPIANNNLITLTASGLVNGSALTGLANIPSGAGKIPLANLTTPFLTGMIMMWSGSIATIPTGWVLCNGANGTPDLRNKFVVCADADVSSVAKSTISGSAAQSGGSTTIDITQMPAHTHNVGASATDTSNGGNITQSSQTSVTLTKATSSAGGGLPYTQPYFALAYIMKT